jgi:Holliday junction resolvase RusA-like endonuclease
VNTLFFNAKRGRVKTTKYQAWLREVSSVIKSQGLVYIPGPVSVEILIIKPDRRRRDLDNMAKSVLDALVLNGVIDDDSLIEKILLAWHSDNLGGCFVEVKSVGDDREGGVKAQALWHPFPIVSLGVPGWNPLLQKANVGREEWKSI